MKNFDSWNRRDFIKKPLALLAATQVFGSASNLFGQVGEAKPAVKPISRTLGKTGLSLPIVSMGVMNADVPGLVRRSYEMGIRHFDTAAGYQGGRNEEMVGRVIKELGVRDKVVIATKAHIQERNRTLTPAEAKARFHEIFAGSLKRLQADYVDILYNHAVDSAGSTSAEGPLEAQMALKKEGKARFIGVSTHSHQEEVLNEVTRLGVHDVVLVSINYTMANDKGLLNAIDAAAKKEIGIIAMKTQAGGTARPDSKLTKPLTPASQTALLKWVLRNESITTAVPGYTTYAQLEQNFSVVGDLAYSPEEREFLSDKNTVADAEFCRQCGECRSDCPLGVDVPQLMRSHMYAVQYLNRPLAQEALATVMDGRGLDACGSCGQCKAVCRNSVNIARKIEQLKTISFDGVLSA